MAFQIDTFATLSSEYKTWDELKAFLTCDDCGKLRIVEPKDSKLAIIRYTKGVSDFTKPHVRFFRSVVWNKETNRPVSVAPPKSMDSVHLEADVAPKVRVTEFVEGTMIQAWREADDQPCQIATRTSLNAAGSFYSKRSFAELLDETLAPQGGFQAFLDSTLVAGTFVSLVLRHKEHRIVEPIPFNRLFVTCYGSVSDGMATMNVDADTWPETLRGYAPPLYEIDARRAVEFVDAESKARGFTWQGIMLQVGLVRWSIRNSAYTFVRTLRGADSSAAARFLRLRASGQMKQYLTYFREESNDMWNYEQKLRARTADLYTAYSDMNKLKTKTMRELPYSFRSHVYALHGKYLASLSGTATPILKPTVVEYVNGLPQEEQLKFLEGDSLPLRVAAQEQEPLAVA